ncbi:MAG: phenylalanine--tRNA ligase subunit alpha [Planctomycetota bacterium]|nr:phenylalanine--tRNA ligase subunit alpha [Planctomycetota bacterium]
MPPFLENLHRLTSYENESLRRVFLGSNGISKSLKSLIKEVPSNLKKEVGSAINTFSVNLEDSIRELSNEIGSPEPISGPKLDVTEPLPPERRPQLGRRHPLTRTTDRLADLLGSLGFEVVEGPEVEDERHNFDDLNIPADHPSRDSFDTFFLKDSRLLLRSQTSTVQVRMMETRKPPLRIIAPGRVYRPDRVDATHGSTFHQIEGLCVDRGVSMADLRGTLQLFMEGLIGAGTRVRFRPSFFPFTEPSAEMDCSCPACGGSGCNVCKGTGWVEMGGCGMVDPAVFEAVNRARGDNAYDPEVWTGFAFGFGIERLAMRRHNITDMRLFLENDLRFLRQI